MPDDALLADYLAGALTPEEEAAIAADDDAARELARHRQLDAALLILLAPPGENARVGETILANFNTTDRAFADRVVAAIAPKPRRHTLAWLSAAAACATLLAFVWMNRRPAPKAPAPIATAPTPAATPALAIESPKPTLPSAPITPVPMQIVTAPTPVPATPSPMPLAIRTAPPMPALVATPAPTPAPLARVETRDAAQWPFAVSSPWNTPLGQAAKLVPSENAVFARCRFSVEQQVIRYANTTDPEVRLTARGQPSLALRWPGLPAALPGDRRVVAVLSPDRSEAIELFAVRSTRPQRIEVERYQRIDLRGAGFGGARAPTESGASTLGGVIRSREIRDGIRHALALTVPAAAVNRHAPGARAYAWPATDAADNARQIYGTRGNLHVGTLLALFDDEEVARALDTQSEPNRVVIRALRDYGAYIVGTHTDAGPLIFFASEGAIIAPTEFSALLPKLRIVADNSAATPGGAGKRRQPPAPPFAADSTPTPR